MCLTSTGTYCQRFYKRRVIPWLLMACFYKPELISCLSCVWWCYSDALLVVRSGLNAVWSSELKGKCIVCPRRSCCCFLREIFSLWREQVGLFSAFLTSVLKTEWGQGDIRSHPCIVLSKQFWSRSKTLPCSDVLWCKPGILSWIVFLVVEKE